MSEEASETLPEQPFLLQSQLETNLSSLAALLATQISILSPKSTAPSTPGIPTPPKKSTYDSSTVTPLFLPSFISAIMLLFQSATASLTAAYTLPPTPTLSPYLDLYSALLSDIYMAHPATPSSLLSLISPPLPPNTLNVQEEARKELERVREQVDKYLLIVQLGEIRGLVL